MYFIANWKMYLNEKESAALAKGYRRIASKVKNKALKIVVCPSTLSIKAVRGELKGTKIKIGAQDGFWWEKGAYTGAVSMWMLGGSGAEFVIVGHSERRRQFKETESDILKKLVSAWTFGLTPVFCLGETLKEREDGRRDSILKTQLLTLEAALKEARGKSGKIIIAYEPVWAIGTGKACNPRDAQDAIQKLDDWIKKIGFKKGVPMLYGGSVDGTNIQNYINLNGVSGVLAGGASVKIKEAEKMLKAFYAV